MFGKTSKSGSASNASAITSRPALGDWNPGNEPLSQVFVKLASSAAGLATTEAATRQVSYGRNVIARSQRRPPWLQILARFRNPLVLTLLIASALSALAGDLPSFVIVLVIVLISVALEFYQETRAQTAVETLRNLVALQATIRRDGKSVSLSVDQVVPGDVVELKAGDLIPADARLIDARDLFVNQALLTGESYPAEKHATDPVTGQDTPEAQNIVFAGTSVVSGLGTALVYRTGGETSIGGLAASLAEKPPATAFDVGIRHFGMLILRLTVLLVLFLLLINISFHRPVLESLMFALALAVGITPELLPMIVTVTLSRAALALADRKVIVKRLAAIHDLGAMDILCTDKTGTLTEARIELVKTIDWMGQDNADTALYAYLNSQFESGMKSPLDDAVLARPIDTAGWQKIDEVPFDFERRRVSVLVEKDGQRYLAVKGAPEDIIRLSNLVETAAGEEPIDADRRKAILAALDGLGQQGYRALGIAHRKVDSNHATAAVTDEIDLVFTGFAVFLDPAKASAGTTIKALGEAGISVRVLTGDNEMVARHVFQQIGIPVTGAISGDQLTKLSQEALIARLPETNLFYRINPQQKLRILLALKRLGHVVGYLGDGINDAPAIHAADIGISVDGAADVARDAADLILLEHDLSVVHQAVIYGRRTVQNVTKYIMMASSSNFGNMFSMAGAALFLPFLPMLPTQVLLNNLLYDISQIAIPFDHVDPADTAAPIKWDIKRIKRFMLLFGPLSSIFDFLTFYVLLHLFQADEVLFHTGWFIESLATQILVVFAIRTPRFLWRSRPHPLLVCMAGMILGIALLVPLTPLAWQLGFTPLPFNFFVYLVAATIAYLGLVELAKKVFRHILEAAPGK